MMTIFRKAKKRLLRPVSLFTFSCIVTIGTLLLYNLPFFRFAIDNSNESTLGVTWLTISLTIIMLVLNFMMTYLTMFCMRVVGRILLALLSVINATSVYFILTYNVIIDETTIGNVFNTRYSEASGFFSWGLWLFILFLGVLPALFCLLQPVKMGKAKKLGVYCGSSLAIVLITALLNINQTLFISQHDTELGGLLQPWSYLVNTCRVINLRQSKKAEEIKLPDGKITDNEKAVVVLVIGESARKANFQLYGYQRDTNPLLSKQEELKVFQANSCATYTTAGTKAILEPQDRSDLYELLPNYAFRMGADVSWRTSNWGEPPIHIEEYLTAMDLTKDIKFYRATPITNLGIRSKEFEVYKPVAANVEEGEKNIGMLVNAYDNTIRYTDFLLNGLINTLRNMEDWKSAMIFISDHGESLGENKIFMHGLPKKMAPKEQYEIPFLVWTSKDFRAYKSELPAVLEQHYIFHSVLNLLSIQSPAYDQALDIFKPASTPLKNQE